MDDRQQRASVTFVQERTLSCQGSWTMPDLAPVEHVLREMAWPRNDSLVREASGIHAFDTGGAVVLERALTEARRQGCEITIEGLRAEYAQLMSLVSANLSAVAAEVPRRQNRLEHLDASIRSRLLHLPRTSRSVGEVIGASKPDIERFSRQTLADTGLLISELRQLTATLNRVAQQIERQPNVLVLGRSAQPKGPGE